MASIRPFRALRPVPEKAAQVSSVPYDVVNSEEARGLAEGNPLSFLHVIRPEIDLPPGVNLYDESVYEQAHRNLKKFIDAGVFKREDGAMVYVYRIVMGNHSQTGIACCCSVDEYDNGIIKKHEHTTPEKEDDRVRHMLSVSAHTGPVLMTYRGRKEIDRITAEVVTKDPLYDFSSPDSIRHTLWDVNDCEAFVKAFRAVPYLYIADGHHRAAGASRVKKEMEKKNERVAGNEEFNFFLAVLFPAEQLKIFAYNRYVSDLGGMNESEFMEAVSRTFRIVESASPEPVSKGLLGMYLGGKWYELRVQSPTSGSTDGSTGPVATLDLTIFQQRLLEPLLGIIDQRNDKRIQFVGGSGSREKLKERVDQGGGVAFTFYPVSLDELMAVADAEMTMPPKSTWFAPKLRSGLLIHQF
jgi:uncharacterized protein (DUF1015 family)